MYRPQPLSTALQLMCLEPVSLVWTFRILVLLLDVSSSVTFSRLSCRGERSSAPPTPAASHRSQHLAKPRGTKMTPAPRPRRGVLGPDPRGTWAGSRSVKPSGGEKQVHTGVPPAPPRTGRRGTYGVK